MHAWMRLGALTLVAATVLSLAGLAAARTRPAQPIRFAVSIRATEDAQWTLSYAASPCTIETGSGTESSAYWTPTPFVIGPLELQGKVRSATELMAGQTSRSGSASFAFSGCAQACLIGGCFSECRTSGSPVGGLFSTPDPQSACPATLPADTSDCGTHSYLMAGNGTQFFLELLHGNDLDFEVHPNTRPYAFGCVAPSVHPLEIWSESAITLAQLEARPLTVIRGTRSWPIDHPDIGYHVVATSTWEIRFQRLP